MFFIPNWAPLNGHSWDTMLLLWHTVGYMLSSLRSFATGRSSNLDDAQEH